MAYSAVVVEDDDSLRMLECEALESLGLVVEQFACADNALFALEQCHDANLVITDIHMPGSLDGVELARESKELPKIQECKDRDMDSHLYPFPCSEIAPDFCQDCQASPDGQARHNLSRPR